MKFHAQWFVFLKSSHADEGALDPCDYILENILELYFKSMGLFVRCWSSTISYWLLCKQD
jgi:hypothetical protein